MMADVVQTRKGIIMKNALFTVLFLAALFLVPNAVFADVDQVKQVGKTIVQIQANGSDTEYIDVFDEDEAKELSEFVSTYNKIISKSNLSPEQLRKELTTAAHEAINQQSSAFRYQYDVKLISLSGSDIPKLKMVVYPQTSTGYHFDLLFTPAS